MEEEITLDIIPIYKNEIYPTKDMIYHTKIRYKSDLEITLQQIKYMFNNCDAVIVLEKGKVIEIL